MATGIYYRDTLQPFTLADQGAITLTTTQKCLWTPGAASVTNLPANFWQVGKLVKITAGLKWTTGTAGTITFGMCVGSADAAAVNVITAARTKIASVGPFLVFAEGYAQCRSVGTAGTISLWGAVHYPIDIILSTNSQVNGFPTAGGTVVSTLDTTAANQGVYFQALTSAGADSVAAVGLVMESLN